MKALLQKNIKVKFKKDLPQNYKNFSKICQMVKEYLTYAT